MTFPPNCDFERSEKSFQAAHTTVYSWEELALKKVRANG
jgi:hypothetical protein